MRTPASFSRSTAADAAPPASSSAISIDSDMVVILASLLCALICVTGLALVARCACRRARRQLAVAATGVVATGSPPPPRGLKKKAIDALPITPASAAGGDCAICLADFAAGEELRVLPHCGHGFHVGCIDTWLGAHATCPSCRVTVAGSSPPPLPDRRCRTCGAACDDVVDAAAAAAAAGARDGSSSLP